MPEDRRLGCSNLICRQNHPGAPPVEEANDRIPSDSPMRPHEMEPLMTYAREMARVCDQYDCAPWSGESEEVVKFAARQRNHWADCPVESSKPPLAFSAVGGGGAGIRWHEVGNMICGYFPGVSLRCSQIPHDARPPRIEIRTIPEPILAESLFINSLRSCIVHRLISSSGGLFCGTIFI